MSKRIFGLDALRAIAIMFVLFTHGGELLASNGFDSNVIVQFRLYASILAFWGVEIFFVLSGFLIGSILLSLNTKFKQFKTLQDFWNRRWLRTLPNYYLFLSLNAWYLYDRYDLTFNLKPYLFFFQNWLWVQKDFFPESWSLAVEEWFYLLFPLMVYLLHKKLTFSKSFLISAVFFICIPILLRYDWLDSGYTNWDREFRKIVLLRLDSVMYGILMAWFKLKQPKIWKDFRNIFLWIGCGIFIWVFNYMLMNGVEPNFAKTLLFTLVSFGSAMFLPFADQWQVIRENIGTLVIRYTAHWSYSLYLVNLLVFQLIQEQLSKLNEVTSLNMLTACILFFVCCFSVSAIAYYLWERPIMNFRRSDISNK